MTNTGNHLPTGLAIGPMRTGSTWLHEYLLRRNDVCLPRGVKETFYFTANYGKGEEWYGRHFSHHDPLRHRVTIEVCPTLFQHREVIGRVRKTLGEPMLLVTLRDPVDRAWSHYMHLRQHGETSLDFDGAAREIPSIVVPGLYARHLSHWLDEFGQQRIRVLFYDELKDHPEEYIRKIDETFGLPEVSLASLPGEKTNSGRAPYNPALAKIIYRAKAKLHNNGLHWVVNAGKRIGLSNVIWGKAGERAKPSLPMSSATRSYLVEQFSPGVEELEKLLGVNLDSWRRKWTMPREQSNRA